MSRMGNVVSPYVFAGPGRGRPPPSRSEEAADEARPPWRLRYNLLLDVSNDDDDDDDDGEVEVGIVVIVTKPAWPCALVAAEEERPQQQQQKTNRAAVTAKRCTTRVRILSAVRFVMTVL